MSEHLPVGIDLGTTHSVVAVFREGQAQVVCDESEQSLVPSVVALDDSDVVVVGRPARERLARGVPNVVSRFKTDMGTDRTWTLGERRLGPTGLSSLVLRDLVAMASTQLGFEVKQAVISVPAWFREPQRRATLEAAQLAGLQVLRLVNEPTAAALHYGLKVDGEPLTVAVLDLGGGTFDITLLELFDGIADVRGGAGDVHLGGEDVTDLVTEWALQSLGLRSVDESTRARVVVAAERAKRLLTSQESAVLTVDERELTLDRSTLEHLAAPFTQRLVKCMREALMSTGIRAGEIDEVLLVGGASRMPLVIEAATKVFGQAPRPFREVDHAVALGAAIQAGLATDQAALRERMVTDVLTHSLGVAITKRWGESWYQDRFDPVLHRGTTLPASRVEQYFTLHHEQESVRFRVYEGERRNALENQYLGDLEIAGLPPHTDPEKRHCIEVRFTHDASGLLEIEARAPELDREVRTVLQRGGIHLEPEEREQLIAKLASLKTHPRQLLPNRYLLERGSRLVELLPRGRREELDQLLLAFEASLDQGEPELIAQRRSGLKSVVDHWSREFDLEMGE